MERVGEGEQCSAYLQCSLPTPTRSRARTQLEGGGDTSEGDTYSAHTHTRLLTHEERLAAAVRETPVLRQAAEKVGQHRERAKEDGQPGEEAHAVELGALLAVGLDGLSVQHHIAVQVIITTVLRVCEWKRCSLVSPWQSPSPTNR